jgi:D-alanyl-D-alanine dipeptidase
LNRAIGGSSSSQHCKGQAMDLELHDKELFDWIIDNLDFDQAIAEFGTDTQFAWFHISYTRTKNRKEVLRATKKAGKTVYSKYIR